MKIHYEKLNESIDLSDRDFADILHKVYNALSDVAFDYHYASPEDLKRAMDGAIEWFQDRFWKYDFDLEESLKEATRKGKEVDLLDDEKTIAYNLHDNDIYRQIQEVLVQAELREISLEDAKNKMIELVRSLEAVSDKQKKVADFNIHQARNLNHLKTTMATYLTGQKVLSNRN